jgi:hypothetical protein
MRNMGSDKLLLYNLVEIPVKRMNKEAQIKLLENFFKKGIEWCNRKYRVYFYGIDAETDPNVWGSIEREVLTFAQIANGFYFVAGPVILVEKKNGEKIHPLLELLRNKKKFKNVKIFESCGRPYYHYMLLLASKKGLWKFEKGLLIVEKPYKIMDLKKPKEMALLEYDSATTKEEIGILFALILQELQDEIKLERKIENPNEMLAFTDSEIEKLVKKAEEKGIEDFNTVTAEEFRGKSLKLP